MRSRVPNTGWSDSLVLEMLLTPSSIRPLAVDTDFETILGTARRRWWIAPIVFLVVGVGVWLQDPETSVQPSYFRLDRNYQVVDNTAALTLLGLPGDLLVPLPSLDTQLAQLTESREFEAITTRYPTVSLNVQRQSPQLALQAQENSEPIVTLRGRTEPVLSLICTEVRFTSCNLALDALRELVMNNHELALERGRESLASSVDELKSQAIQNATLRERLEVVEFGLRALSTQPLTDVVLIKEFNAEEDETTITESTNYRFVFALTTVLLVLLLLQWSVIDKTIYGVRRIARALGIESVLARVRTANDAVTIAAVSAAIKRLVGPGKSLRLIVSSGVDMDLLNTITKNCKVPFSVIDTSALDHDESSSESSVTLLIAQHGSTSMTKLAQWSETTSISSGGRPHVLLLG